MKKKKRKETQRDRGGRREEQRNGDAQSKEPTLKKQGWGTLKFIGAEV